MEQKKLTFKFFFKSYNFEIFWKFWNFMKFSNILISKKQFLCNKKPYCTLMPRNFIYSRLHFYFKIYSLKDIWNFRYSNQKIITLVPILPAWVVILISKNQFLCNKWSYCTRAKSINGLYFTLILKFCENFEIFETFWKF
jgi:hypothetical protein